jgi:hypothetical protein
MTILFRAHFRQKKKFCRKFLRSGSGSGTRFGGFLKADRDPVKKSPGSATLQKTCSGRCIKVDLDPDPDKYGTNLQLCHKRGIVFLFLLFQFLLGNVKTRNWTVFFTWCVFSFYFCTTKLMVQCDSDRVITFEIVLSPQLFTKSV